MNRLAEQLARCRADRRLLLVGYLPAGYPPGDGLTACVRAAFEAGADALEIALPNARRSLDGPLIRDAVSTGATAGMSDEDAVRSVVEGRAHPGQAVIVMAYRDAFDRHGAAGLIRLCRSADADAVLLPEHSVAEQLELAHRSRAAGVEQVIFIHREQDLPQLAASAPVRPIVYVQSASGPTGGTFDAATAVERVSDVRSALAGQDAAVLVGFGIRGPDEAERVRTCGADGVVVGTALVAAAAQGPERVRHLVESLQPALQRPASPAA